MTSILTSSRERSRFMRFAFVGVVGAIVDFGTFNLLVSVFDVREVYAQVISFIAAIISNFTWNRFWTYPDSRGKPVGRQIIQFTIVSIIGLLIRTPVFAFLEPRLTVLAERYMPMWSPLHTDVIGHNAALAVAVIIVMMWNFFVNRYWTYNDVDKAM